MSAIETFDWYTKKVWNDLDEKTRDFIKKERSYLMGLRSEDERKRFVFDYIRRVYEKNGQASTGSYGG